MVCNDVGVVEKAELYPKMGVLVVILGTCVGWMPADVTSVPLTYPLPQCVNCLSLCQSLMS